MSVPPLNRVILRKYLAECLEAQYPDEDVSEIVFDHATDMLRALAAARKEIQALLDKQFKAALDYAEAIKDDVEAREDVKGKFA